MPTKPTPSEPPAAGATFAARRAERERAEAAGEIEPAGDYRPRTSLRVGVDNAGGNLVITHAQV